MLVLRGRLTFRRVWRVVYFCPFFWGSLYCSCFGMRNLPFGVRELQQRRDPTCPYVWRQLYLLLEQPYIIYGEIPLRARRIE